MRHCKPEKQSIRLWLDYHDNLYPNSACPRLAYPDSICLEIQERAIHSIKHVHQQNVAQECLTNTQAYPEINTTIWLVAANSDTSKSHDGIRPSRTSRNQSYSVPTKFPPPGFPQNSAFHFPGLNSLHQGSHKIQHSIFPDLIPSIRVPTKFSIPFSRT